MPRRKNVVASAKASAGVSQAVASRDRIRVLGALAEKLAASIDASTSSRDTAALAKQLRDTLAALDAAGALDSAVPDVVQRALSNRRAK
jgi:hypothetical protein